jgi:integrase
MFEKRNQRLKQQSPTLKQALERYLKDVSSKKRGGDGTDKHLTKVWCSTTLANRPISTITQHDLVRYRDEWLKEISGSTVVRRLAIMSHLFTIARKDWGMLYIDDPSKTLRKPIVQDARERRIIDNLFVAGKEIPTDELTWIIRNTNSKHLPTIINLAVETAMRRSEIINLRREHINFDEGCILIPKTKNGKSRTIPLSPWASYTLIQYIALNNRAGNLFDVSESAITRSFIRAIRKARKLYLGECNKQNIPANNDFLVNLRFHDLRHEATSRLATVYEMHELAKITGHSDTRMLLRYYHPDVKHLTMKLANSEIGRKQFGKINRHLLSTSF